MNKKKILFVTGTDTGVGKTLLSALLLHHLRQSGVHALAMKPFCSGGTADVRLLQSLQPGELPNEEMNPFYFPQPIAPLVAASKKNPVRLTQVLKAISRVEKKCERLVIEGSGGLMVPLGGKKNADAEATLSPMKLNGGEGAFGFNGTYTIADVIAKLDCRVIVAARNRLGTINHTLLTLRALAALGVSKKNVSVVMMCAGKKDLSSRSNVAVIRGLIAPISVFEIPFLGRNANSATLVKRNHHRLKTTLSEICAQESKPD